VNKPHLNNDVNRWTNGVWIPARVSDAAPRRRCDATQQAFTDIDGYFYDAAIGALIDFTAIDGLMWVIWQGNYNIYGTTRARCDGDAMRWGVSIQINKQLDAKVTAALQKAMVSIRDDKARKGQ
jgi:hypothetical protein